MPDLRGKTEIEAFNLLSAAGLTLGHEDRGVRSDRAGRADDQPEPAAPGSSSNKGTPIDYVLSKGPEPIAPAPRRPQPLADARRPTPTPPPTPPPPTPTPTPAKVTVADYRCQTLAAATTEITGDHLTVGRSRPSRPATRVATTRSSSSRTTTPGSKVAPNTPIDLTVYDPASLGTCPPP